MELVDMGECFVGPWDLANMAADVLMRENNPEIQSAAAAGDDSCCGRAIHPPEADAVRVRQGGASGARCRRTCQCRACRMPLLPVVRVHWCARRNALAYYTLSTCTRTDGGATQIERGRAQHRLIGATSWEHGAMHGGRQDEHGRAWIPHGACGHVAWVGVHAVASEACWAVTP
eukprot:scaffold10667_cov132-Isochrysis_galbana.AAC.3